ncbi:branched-chain amino acid transport system II carrier protein [Clostridium psychrophilum]|nr:branched-chain amino acid transport system II carrier protein [Clostridium psychrophilum]
MFFGAGNLIFPPALGKAAGDSVLFSIIGFLITGVGIPICAIIACAKINGDFKKMADRVGPIFSVIVSIALVLIIGPLFAIPRTAATTFELGIHPLFPSIGQNISIIVFFAIVLAFALKPSTIIDKIGKVLTPALLLMLAIIIVKGIIYPIGPIVNTSYQGGFSKALIEGYQTMDAMTGVIFSSIIISSIRAKGYKSQKDIMTITMKSALVSLIGLSFVYTGLMYLGTQTTTLFSKSISRTSLVTEIVKLDLGSMGSVILSLCVTLACLTTAIGILSAGSKFFAKLFNGKLSYKSIAIGIALVSGVMATKDVDSLVKLANPILKIIYPIVIVLIVTTLLGDIVKNNKVVTITTYTVLIVSVLNTIIGLTANSSEFFKYVPLASVGFAWVIPAVIAFVISNRLVNSNQQNKVNAISVNESE